EHFKTLSPARADVEIRSLQRSETVAESKAAGPWKEASDTEEGEKSDLEMEDAADPADFDELAAFVRAMTYRLSKRQDFECTQTWMSVFLRVHAEVIKSDAAAAARRKKPARPGKRALGEDLLTCLQHWKDAQAMEVERLGNWCLIVAGLSAS